MVAEDRARRTLADLLDEPAPLADPLTELSRLAGQVAQWKDILAESVAALSSLRYEGTTGESVRGEVLLFERALDRCAGVLTAVARLGIDERLARVTERQAEMVATALAAALAEMGLAPEVQREARSRVAARLRLVAG